MAFNNTTGKKVYCKEIETNLSKDEDSAPLQGVSTYVTHVGEDLTKRSRIVDPQHEDSIAKLATNEIVLGEQLGSGDFNHIYEVCDIELMEHSSSFSEHEQEARSVLAKKCGVLAKKCLHQKYAIKFLNHKTINNPEEHFNAAADLFVEAKYLSSLAARQHPNIIRLHGLAAEGASGFSHHVEGGYFLIIDRLCDTLDQRIEIWKEIETRTRAKNDSTDHKIPGALLLTRLKAAFDLCSALRYLHGLKIMYRDLKPGNVGFDCNGTLKLFDFGLAKELVESRKFANGTYEMSGDTGSRRYMSPEVVLCEPYNLSADVYSFSLLLWQMCSLKDPYDNMRLDEHLEFAVHGNERPEIDESWPSILKHLLAWGWMRDPGARPSMKDVYKLLKIEIRKFDLGASSWPSQDLCSMTGPSLQSQSHSKSNVDRNKIWCKTQTSSSEGDEPRTIEKKSYVVPR